MLLRQDDRGVLAIGQPSHAWLSGQLARAWGNERFGAVDPWEEVCLAAEQHDIGLAGWDLEPKLNPETGLPYTFIEMPLADHLGCWRLGPPRLLSQSRYAALLCSMHGARLYGMRDLERMAPADATAVRTLLVEMRAFQDRLTASLRDEPAAGESMIRRNSQLVWTWDYLSLALCLDWAPCAAKRVPAADGAVELALRPGVRAGQVAIDPWPFAAGRVTVRCEGQRLRGRYDSEGTLRTALRVAPWETLAIELVRARSA